MGNRGHVHIEDSGVWLYTHWGASRMPHDVAEALSREERWGDPEYLARIIFDEMIGDQQGTETGYGIGTARHGDVGRVVHVNCDLGTVRVEEGGAFDRPSETVFNGTFEEYVEEHRVETEVA